MNLPALANSSSIKAIWLSHWWQVCLQERRATRST